jgi:hypothetical protein
MRRARRLTENRHQSTDKGLLMRYFVGVDGCKAGWFVVALCASQTWQLGVYKTIAQL